MIPGLTIRQLPVLDAPPAQPILDGVRIRMAAGEAAPVFNGGPWSFIAWLEFAAGTGAWRGNHFHEQKTEYFYVIRGTLLGRFEDMNTGEYFAQELPEGTVIVIEPRVAHAFQGVGYAHCMECSPYEFDASDAYPHVPGSRSARR